MRGAALACALKERLRYSGPAPCPLCDADGKRCTQDGPCHLFCECTHPAVQGKRESLQSTLPALLERPTTLISKALRAHTAPAETHPSRRVSDLRDTLLVLAEAANWQSRDGKAIIYRLVTVMPFQAKVATARPDLLPQLQMVDCLGQIFDSTVVQDRRLRLLANNGVKWAASQIRRFAHARADALGAAHPPAQKVLLTAMLPTLPLAMVGLGIHLRKSPFAKSLDSAATTAILPSSGRSGAADTCGLGIEEPAQQQQHSNECGHTPGRDAGTVSQHGNQCIAAQAQGTSAHASRCVRSYSQERHPHPYSSAGRNARACTAAAAAHAGEAPQRAYIRRSTDPTAAA